MARRTTTKIDPAAAARRAAQHPDRHGRFERGDAVRVKGLRGTFTWQYANRRADGTLDSYTLVGGTGGHKAYRSVAPDRVTKKRSRADRPQQLQLV